MVSVGIRGVGVWRGGMTFCSSFVGDRAGLG